MLQLDQQTFSRLSQANTNQETANPGNTNQGTMTPNNPGQNNMNQGNGNTGARQPTPPNR